MPWAQVINLGPETHDIVWFGLENMQPMNSSFTDMIMFSKIDIFGPSEVRALLLGVAAGT